MLNVAKDQAEEKDENDDTRVPADEGTELTTFYEYVKASVVSISPVRE